MRVLVTGVTGQVGGALVRLAGGKAAEGVEIVGVGRDRLDLAQPGRIDGALDAVRPDLVINPAAYTAVDKAEQEPDLAFTINRDGPAALAAACAERRIGLIHVSTDYVFDGAGTRPYRPEDPVSPLGVYGVSKEAGETAIRHALEDHVILRTAWVYAARGGNFMNTMLRVGKDRDELRVVDDQHGTPTGAVDIASALLALVRARMDGAPVAAGTYHYTADGATTWHGFAEAIFDRAEPLWGRRPTVHAIPTSEYPTPARRPAYSVLDTSALIGALPTLPHRSWQAALDEVFAARMAAEETVR
ncbi:MULTISPECIES: dTDP-4-dehydrorhamnose reductase [Thalassobaculum]|uniref:dTDP-4-dehydrorhamnose reductase n=1 Tax=Thalassobaculum litoreum DSM 18839 TaxID=1123362 RepID=A0A8G2EZ74_9PROT|nr:MULTISPECIES: dTDP-4-dehydrorhamnose reductase [Thalassobaculum]SDF94463.1 dTDP-4-dehydrorhamnose reductase [Thalassobaculum litoreum DSM 18839]